MSELARSEYVVLITQSQRTLYAFIRPLVNCPDEAEDVLQETNMTLWEQASRFEKGTNFTAWACRVAYYQVLTHRKKRRRERARLQDRTLEQIAGDLMHHVETLSERQRALLGCLEALPASQRELLEIRYASGESVEKASSDLGRSAGAIYQKLYRIRTALRDCVERRLAGSAP